MPYLLCLLLLIASTAMSAYQQTFTLQEHLGYAWDTDFVHQTITVPASAKLSPKRLGLFADKSALPMQVDGVQTYPDGRVKQAEVWFRSDLPDNGMRTFKLRTVRWLSRSARQTDLTLKRACNVLEVGNSLTAVRVPAGSWNAPAGTPAEVKAALAKFLGVPAGENCPGPLLGVRLASGAWTAAAETGMIDLPNEPMPGLYQTKHVAAGAFLGYATEVTAQGPLFIRTRTVYRFAGDGEYTLEITLRAGEPLVRVDERYRRAGAVRYNISALQPTAAKFESFRPTPEGKSLALAYDKPACPGLFVGWDFYFGNIAPAFLFTGDPGGNALGIMSTDADWLPFPYDQGLHLLTAPGPSLSLAGPLDDGHRHWAFYVGKDGEFHNPGRDYYRWWYHHVVLPLDKVANWQLTWPGMAQQEFPHTFFGKVDIPAIRTRWKDDPVITAFVKGVTPNPYTGQSDAAAAFLATGDAKYLQTIIGPPDKPQFLDTFIKAHLTGSGLFEDNGFDFMTVTDQLFQRLTGWDLLLGSDALTPEQRTALLSKLAFAVYVMHDRTWWPPNYPFEPTQDAPYPAYVQGTPNQKHCYYAGRAMTACLLGNHPELSHWLATAVEENERVMPGSVAENGVYVESAFYSARDTMRFGPFWTALTRAGVKDPAVQKWLRREKLCFQYMSDLLTPPDPRFGGRRVYHPLGRSSSGVIDPTFMIAAFPFGDGDPAFTSRMRWAWESQGKPAPTITGTTGGRDTTLTLLGYDRLLGVEPGATPLADVRWDGFGAIFRSQVGSDFESNVVFRHGPFAWDMYEQNNGGVYFYGKGAPLLPRFGGYWNGSPNLMSLPFGNRVQFDGIPYPEWLNGVGALTDFAALGNLAGYAAGVTRDTFWRRGFIFAKDLTRDDPVYLLVRDDISRPQAPTALHWWVMSKAVQPDGVEKPGVVPGKGYTDAQWIANMGKNWKDAPTLHGQTQHFTGQCGVDVDMFIAAPTAPELLTDAAGAGPGLAYCVNPKLIEYQQLVRIAQPAGKPYLTLLTPRWPGSAAPTYRTIADGNGVAITRPDGEDRLFLAEKTVTYHDDAVSIDAHAGFARLGGAAPLRLMVIDGEITAGNITLTSTAPAALLYDGKTITLHSTNGAAATVKATGATREAKVVVIED